MLRPLPTALLPTINRVQLCDVVNGWRGNRGGGGAWWRLRTCTRVFEGACVANVPSPCRAPGLIDVLKEYPKFEQLTSISVNSTNTQLCVSGYSSSVWLYDVETAQVIQKFNNIHEQHINITRFSNHSPNVFATSSFDKKVKMWDSRTKCTAPTYERQYV